MLDNEIVLNVVEVVGNAAVEETFVRFEENLHRTKYIGPGHTLALPYQLDLYRTLPKPQDKFLGVARTSIKLTKNKPVDDAAGQQINRPAIAEISFSIPVGMDPNVIFQLRSALADLLTQEPLMTNFVELLSI